MLRFISSMFNTIKIKQRLYPIRKWLLNPKIRIIPIKLKNCNSSIITIFLAKGKQTRENRRIPIRGFQVLRHISHNFLKSHQIIDQATNAFPCCSYQSSSRPSTSGLQRKRKHQILIGTTFLLDTQYPRSIERLLFVFPYLRSQSTMLGVL